MSAAGLACGACGSELGAGDRFCPECGTPAPAASVAPAVPAPSVDPAADLANSRTLTNLAFPQRHPTPAPGGLSAPALRLFVQLSPFVAERHGLVRCLLVHTGFQTLEQVKLGLGGDAFGGVTWQALGEVSPGDERTEAVPLTPQVGGELLLRFVLRGLEGTLPFVLRGSVSVRAKHPADAVHKYEAMAQAVNALVGDKPDAATEWRDVALALDVEATEAARRNHSRIAPGKCSRCGEPMDAGEGARQALGEAVDPRAQPACARCGAVAPTWLHKKRVAAMSVLATPRGGVRALLRLPDWNRDFVLVGKREAKLGRKPEANDVVLWMLPRGGENDRLSERISREHARIVDTGDTWELHADRPMRTQGVVPASSTAHHGGGRILDGATLEFGGVLTLRATDCGGALRLDRVGNGAGQETYILLRTDATIGRDPRCALVLDHPSIEPVHARIVLIDGMLWVENLVHRTASILLNEAPVGAEELRPLSPASRLRAGILALHLLDTPATH